MAHGMSFRMKRTNEFRELTPYGTMSKMKKDREQREKMCRKGLYRACQVRKHTSCCCLHHWWTDCRCEDGWSVADTWGFTKLEE